MLFVVGIYNNNNSRTRFETIIDDHWSQMISSNLFVIWPHAFFSGDLHLECKCGKGLDQEGHLIIDLLWMDILGFACHKLIKLYIFYFSFFLLHILKGSVFGWMNEWLHEINVIIKFEYIII